MANDVAMQQGAKLSNWVANPEAKQRIGDALGGVMPVDVFTAHMLTAFQDPTVKNCTPLSQYTALHECAAMGLLPTLNQVKLIPYKDIIKAMPQWQGLKALMERAPDVLEVTAALVHIRDEFSFIDGQVRHAYDPFDSTRSIESSKDIRGGYVKVVYRDGRPPRYHTVTVAHIEKCRKCAQTQNVWTNWYAEMALKTLYRDAFARRVVPLDPFVASRLQKAFDIDDLNLGNMPTAPVNGKTKTAALLDVSSEPAPPAETPPQTPPEAAPSDSEPPAVHADASRDEDILNAMDALEEGLREAKKPKQFAEIRNWINDLKITETVKTEMRRRVATAEELVNKGGQRNLV